MKQLIGMTALAAVWLGGPAHAQVNVKIGVLSDVSSLYSDIGGAGSVAAAKLAIADYTAAIDLDPKTPATTMPGPRTIPGWTSTTW